MNEADCDIQTSVCKDVLLFGRYHDVEFLIRFRPFTTLVQSAVMVCLTESRAHEVSINSEQSFVKGR